MKKTIFTLLSATMIMVSCNETPKSNGTTTVSDSTKVCDSVCVQNTTDSTNSDTIVVEGK